MSALNGLGIINGAGVVNGQGFTPTNSFATRSGLISYWNLQSTADAAGANTLTNNAGVTFTSGLIGNASTYASASSQFMSVASNSGLQTGSVDYWVAAWFNYTGVVTRQMIITKDQDGGGKREYFMDVESSKLNFGMFSAVDTVHQMTNTVTLLANTWNFGFAYWDSVNQVIGTAVNFNAIQTLSVGAAQQAASTSPVEIGARAFSTARDFANGQIQLAAFGKSPPGGIAAVASQIASTLYNSGNGRLYPF